MSNAEDPRELARRLAEEARAKATAKPAAAPKTQGAKKSSRVAKYAKGKTKALSAKEALQAAIEAETGAAKKHAEAVREKAHAKQKADLEAKKALAKAEAAKARATKPRKAKAEPDTDTGEAPAKAAPASSPRKSTQPAVTSPGELLTKRLPAFQAERIVTIERREAFRGVWSAHRTRAGVEQDAALLATADMLLDAAKRLPPRAFHAARVTAQDGTAWAVFVDTASGSLLAAVTPADVYLVGLR